MFDALRNLLTSIGFCVFRLHKTTILGTLLNIPRRSFRNVPKNGTTLQVGISNARLTASQYCGVFSFELNASVRNLKPGISSVIVNHNGRNASILFEKSLYVFPYLKPTTYFNPARICIALLKFPIYQQVIAHRRMEATIAFRS